LSSAKEFEMKIFWLTNLFSLFVFSAIYANAADKSKADLIVASDGSGNVRTVQEAVDKVPENNLKRFVIFIKPGVYREQIRIPTNKPFVSFVGEKAETTKLTFNLSNKDAGSTSASYSFYVAGHDFYAENISFENSYGQGSQAVAVLTEADRLIFKDCRFLGWQDTLYAKNGRQFFENCYIEGHVDFIFGQAAAVFENCEIHSKGDGYIAAPMRFSAGEPSGFVFNKSKLTAENTDKGVYLARPWRDYGRTVYLETEMGAHIRSEGWNNWLPEREKTAYFAEYKSSGAGAKMNERVKWIHQLTETEAKQFETKNFLKGKDNWNPKKIDYVWQEKNAPDYEPVSWKDVFKQTPAWYQTDEAARIADQIILYQKDNGGWEKNLDMTLMLTQKEKSALAAKKSDISETTIDNRTTYTQIQFLGKIITASLAKPTPPNNFSKYKEAFGEGLDYLLSSQYENGGFPQFYPLKKGYYTHITFNDDAMIGVLKILRDVAKKKEDYLFVEEAKRLKAEKAVEKGTEIVLKTQVEIDGVKTVWAAQYDETTLKPAAARKFEPVSLTAGESVGIVRFLMLDAKPNQRTIDAIESAVKWFRANKIEGIRWERKNGENSVVKDKNASPIWARFYQIETMKPIFIGRDAIIKYDVSEIEAERRNGYAWYVSEPNELLEKDYPKWLEKIKKN
jgi:PelA/Pel-15E family pectate lyase